MSHFILMLTRNDVTVANAMAVYQGLRGSPLQYVGFKDIGLPMAELKALAAAIRKDGRKVLLEVVSAGEAAELASVEAACEIGVDYLLGGRHVEAATRILRGSAIRYFPFAGETVGHPTSLLGSEDDIVADARRLAALPGVHGLDLLAYRYAGDVRALTRRVVAAVDMPVIAAGSINGPERVATMLEAGVWGFTVGSAIFEGAFLTHGVETQVERILSLDGVAA